MKRIVVLVALCLLAALPAQAAAPTARQFISANCEKMTNACTDTIVRALDDAMKAGKISAKCAAARPPKQAVGLDIALWLYGHHDLDNKPIGEAAVLTAERLWPCSRVAP